MLKQGTQVFFIGIKGVAMANLAVILKKMGLKVKGADTDEEFITDNLLARYKIEYFTGFDKENLPPLTDLIVYSAAHKGINNPLAKEGKKRGIRILSQAKLIGEMSKQFNKVIAVCGCHGKTTTSSLLVYALKNLGKKPSYLVGAPDFNGFPGGDLGEKDYFVVEADEYGVNPPLDKTPKFSFLNPDYTICTNIDFDHPDVYKSLKETKDAFLNFFKKESKLFFCSDDANLMEVAKKLPREKYLTFGPSERDDFNLNKENFSLSIPGAKNRLNAGGVILVLLNLGFDLDDIKKAIIGFTGAKRRFEKIYHDDTFSLYDDYAHHPAEIKATIMAAKEKFPGKRIIIVFQPHTYSRTALFLAEFADSLSMSDFSYVLPIFASAREQSSDFKISSQDIEKEARAAGKTNVLSVETNQDLLDDLRSRFQKNDVIITMGAGDVYKLSDDIIRTISKRKA